MRVAMTKLEYRARIAFGWLCYRALLLIPGRYVLKGPVSLWLLGHAGFYGYDEGYASYRDRSEETR